MKKKFINIGFIGAGMIGQVGHISCYQKTVGCRLSALAELRPELGEKVAKQKNIRKLYKTHFQLIQDPAIDAVIVVTKRPTTGPVVLDALNAGKHVLSEKPMAHSVEQAQLLVTKAQQKNLKYSIGFMKRHDPGVIFAKKILEQARLDLRWGELVSIHCYSHGGNFAPHCQKGLDYIMTEENRPEGINSWKIAPNWLDKSLHDEYASFLNVFSHDLNLIRYLAGTKPEVLSASFCKKNYGVVLDSDGVKTTLEFSEKESTNWNEGVTFTFKNATLAIQLAAPLDKNKTAKIILTIAGKSQNIAYTNQNKCWAFQNQASAFIEDIRHNRVPITSGADSLCDLFMAEKIWRFYKT